MAERIVVSLHLRGAGSPESGYLRRGLAAKKRAEALGGALCAWGPESFAFDFAAAGVEEAVDLALATFDDPSSPGPRFGAGVAFGELTRIEAGGAPAVLAWGEPLSVAWRLARFAEPGEVLIDPRCRAQLSEALRTRGERRIEPDALTALVLDTHQPFQRDTLIDSLGVADSRVRVTVPPLPPIPGLSRDVWERVPAPVSSPAFSKDEPPPTLRTASSSEHETAAFVPVPAVVVVPVDLPPSVPAGAPLISEPGAPGGAPAPPEPSELAVPEPARSEAGPPEGEAARAEPPEAEAPEADLPETRTLEGDPPDIELSEAQALAEEDAEPPESAEPETSRVAPWEPLSGEREAVIPPLPATVVPPPRLPLAGSAPTVRPPGLFGQTPESSPPLENARISWPGAPDEYADLTAAARKALLKGNVSELERLSDELKSRGEADLAERMAGFVAWNRGAKAEGLRKLRMAADAETRPAHRARALLAYGVALAASGRTDAALFAALGALARAREVADRHGEHVCARFLARLAAAAGYEHAARTWADVAEEIPAPGAA